LRLGIGRAEIKWTQGRHTVAGVLRKMHESDRTRLKVDELCVNLAPVVTRRGGKRFGAVADSNDKISRQERNRSADIG
jgi:hypothetical protein